MGVNIIIKSDPKGFAKGRFVGEVGPEGLTLTKGSKPSITLPIGSNAQYLGKNKLSVLTGQHQLTLTVTKFGTHQNRMAQDLVKFLQGDPQPDLGSYRLPWYFYLISVLPIGIPIITLGGALPTGLGIGLAFACLGVAQYDDWKIATRIAVMLGLVVLGYILLVGLILLIALNQ